MPVEITSTSESATPGLEAHLWRAAEVLLDALDHGASELDVTLVTDDEITELNQEYRGMPSATDVLSFSQLEGEAVVDGEDDVHLGDIAISLDTAWRQATDGGWGLEEETTRLLLHGVLHLLGFDHENGGEEEARMKAEEDRLVAVLHAAGIACAHQQPGASS